MPPASKNQAVDPEQQRNNRRLGWALAVVVVVIFVGFIAKSAWLGM